MPDEKGSSSPPYFPAIFCCLSKSNTLTHAVLVDELDPAISLAFCLWGFAGVDQALNRIEPEGSHFAARLTKL